MLTGEDQPAGGWIKAAELFSRRARTPYDMKLWGAESFLEADALSWYMNLEAEGGISAWEDCSHRLRIIYGRASPLSAKERPREVRMAGSLGENIARLNRLRLDCIVLSLAKEVEMFTDALHPETMRRVAAKTPATKEEATELVIPQ